MLRYSQYFGYVKNNSASLAGLRNMSIESMIKKSDCRIEDLLAEDEFVTEINNQNPSLINLYFYQKAFQNSMTKRRMRKMIEYAITEPDSDADQLRTYKFPFMSSEVLSATNGALLDLYFSTEPEENLEEDQLFDIAKGKQEKSKKGVTVIKIETLVENESAKMEPTKMGSAPAEREQKEETKIENDNEENEIEKLKENTNPELKPQTNDTQEKPMTENTVPLEKPMPEQQTIPPVSSEPEKPKEPIAAQPEPPKQESAQAQSAKTQAETPHIQPEPKPANSENSQTVVQPPILPSPPAAIQEESKKIEQGSSTDDKPLDKAKAILDDCIADLEQDCNVENNGDSAENTANNSSEDSSNSKYDLVNLLFSFVDVEPGTELNELLAGYFKRAALALISGRPKEMADYFENNSHVIQNLFVHCTNKSVSEVLCKALSIDDSNVSNPIRFTQIRNDILHGILARLEDKTADSYTLDQLAQTFCDLSDQSKEISALSCCIEVLRKIFTLSLEKNSDISAAALKILIKLLTPEKTAAVAVHLKDLLENCAVLIKKDNPENKIESPPENISENEELLKLINTQLSTYKDILLADKDAIENQFCTSVKPFGTHRLKIVEYLHVLIKLTIFPVIDQMYQLQIPKILYDLFVRFPFNSVLHSIVYELFKSVFESDSKSLLHVFVLNTGFINFLITTSKEPYYQTKTGRNVRKPYAGHITKLSNHLEKLSTSNQEIDKYLRQNKMWLEYCVSTLAEENEKNETALGGRRAISEINENTENQTNEKEEQHLVFEGGLSAIFKKLKEITFDNVLEEPEQEETEETVEVKENAEEEENKSKAEEKKVENIRNEPEITKNIDVLPPLEKAYMDSEYWSKGFMYKIENIASDYE